MSKAACKKAPPVTRPDYFENDPSNFFDTSSLPHYELPEKNLWFAVIRTAIVELDRWHKRREFKYAIGVQYSLFDRSVYVPGLRDSEVREIIAWLFDDGRDPFSFLWICDHLDYSDRVVKLIRSVALNRPRVNPHRSRWTHMSNPKAQ